MEKQKAPSRCYKTGVILVAVASILWGACRKMPNDHGNIIFKDHVWLRGKRIFLDPGHGGQGRSDPSRIGPNGVSEESLNLEVSLILAQMLRSSGAVVAMSRDRDRDVSFYERIQLAEKFKPELLVSLHHNGSPRSADAVNYPCVLIWGSRHVSPDSYEFAKILIGEFNRIMDPPGPVLSDFSVYSETGTHILRESRNICPGVIGEPGFFSDERFSRCLADPHHLQVEAEAYFNAISRYFEWGVPSAEVWFSCPFTSKDFSFIMIDDRHPRIYLKMSGGISKPGIEVGSLRVTIDNIEMKCRKINEGLYSVVYGKELYPGRHNLRFSFRNMRGQSSPIFSALFSVRAKAGDYDRLVAEGKKLLRRGTYSEGLKMLISALSLGMTDPQADELLWTIAGGFERMGDRANAQYHFRKLYHFYPESKRSRSLERKIYSLDSHRYSVEHLGRPVPVLDRKNPSPPDDCR